VAHQVIYRRKVDVHPPGKFGLELTDLQVHDDETPLPLVIEEQIEVVVLTARYPDIRTRSGF
jgi:hypothetical protein